MIVAAHQSHYLPWLGYLDKLAKADRFILMDDLQYEDQNFQNRQRLKLNDGPHWLTVPLVRGSQSDRIVDKKIDNTGQGSRHHWQRRTWRTLQVHYGRAPHFDHYAQELEIFYTRKWSWLIDLQLYALDLASAWLGLSTPIVRASTLHLRGAKTDRILDLCEKTGAKIYLTGAGGSAGYLDTDKLAAAGVSTLWQRFSHPVYPQRYPGCGFVSHLAFVDLLLNCGPESAAVVWPTVMQASQSGS